jgi:metal-responsive CopG/Arc/MetJ family transcriptional regulator
MILHVKAEKETIEKLDRIVRKRAYKNKSEAVRKMLEEHFKEHPELFGSEEMEERFKLSGKMSDERFERLAARVFRGSKTAAQIVAEGRER